MASVLINGRGLPEPTSLSVNDELIWSSDTGRTLSGKFVGSLLGEKQTFQVKWTNLTITEFNNIKSALKPKYFKVNILGEQAECYRSTIAREPRADATGYYGSVSVDFIER